jgi:hypothetical protein
MAPKYLKWNNGYEIGGFWYPRVTSICKIIRKPGLDKWLANQGSFSAMKRKRKKITEWGTSIHDTIEKIMLGRIPKINPAIRPSIDAFLEWFKKHRIDVFGVEKRVLSKKHFYSGTFDVLAEIDGKTGILDLKTSREIWDDYFIQTAAYFQAHNEGMFKKANTYWVLRIDQYQECKLCGAKKRDKGGEPQINGEGKKCAHKWKKLEGVCELKEVHDKQAYIDTFLTAKKLWEFSNREWLSKIPNYPGRNSIRQ